MFPSSDDRFRINTSLAVALNSSYDVSVIIFFTNLRVRVTRCDMYLSTTNVHYYIIIILTNKKEERERNQCAKQKPYKENKNKKNDPIPF